MGRPGCDNEPQISILSEQHHDSPYLDQASSSRQSSPARHPKSQSAPSRDRSAPPVRNHAGPRPHQARGNNGGASSHGVKMSPSPKPAPSRKRGRRRGNGTYRQPDELTSHPTTRNAYVETREWLLKEHGPVCAYCGLKHAAKLMTLDHVAPRRGQTAYDRRDNLVLACQTCNAAKRDLAPLAFLLGVRARAKNLVRFGAHLSAGLIEMARSLIPVDQTNSSGAANIDHDRWGEPVDKSEDSPYKE